MLTASFFTAVFLSLCWIIYIVAYLSLRLAGIGIGSLGLTDLFLYTAAAALPLWVIWSVWGYFYRFAQSRQQQKQFQLLLQQQQHNQEYFEMIGRILLQAEQNRKDDFVIGRIDLFIAEMNELLSDLMERYSLASADKIKILWGSVKNGNRWGFAKAIIELKNNVENFDEKILDAAGEDPLLTGIINEFCARYAKLTELLKQHDNEKIFLEMVETGALGRVFAIFAPLSDRLALLQSRETGLTAAIPLAVCRQDEPIAEAGGEEDDELPELVLTTDEETEMQLEEAGETAEPEQAEEYEDNGLYEGDVTDGAALAKIEEDVLEPETADESDIISILGGGEDRYGADEEGKPDRPARKKISFKLPKLSEIFKWQKEEDPDDWIKPHGDIDPLTLALERSFGRLADTSPEKPLRDITAADAAKISEPQLNGKFAFANTDKTLKNLQKEWEEMKKEKSAANAGTEDAPTIDLEEELDEIEIATPEEKAADGDEKN